MSTDLSGEHSSTHNRQLLKFPETGTPMNTFWEMLSQELEMSLEFTDRVHGPALRSEVNRGGEKWPRGSAKGQGHSSSASSGSPLPDTAEHRDGGEASGSLLNNLLKDVFLEGPQCPASISPDCVLWESCPSSDPSGQGDAEPSFKLKPCLSFPRASPCLSDNWPLLLRRAAVPGLAAHPMPRLHCFAHS